ncbi:Hypothetical predicted protein [Cloeon dipterum]|uniref:Uncharacterized protein n=1 Tax=Cloeon dipterum TaxID=197152 RepID=A0A8S1DW49_9INSE|nr:Hypothetical predicted protein [Cloeon dipterum]
MTPKNSAPDETEQQVKESLHDLAKSESFNFTGLSKEMKYRLWSLLPNRRALMDYVMDNYAFEVFKRPGTNNLLWSEENRETLRNAIFNKLSYSTPVNKEDYLVVVESKAKDLIVHSQKLHDNKDFLKTLTDKIVISVLDNDFLTDQHNAHMEMLNLLQNRGSSLVTSSFDNFIIRIGKMSDKQFEEYLTATLDHKNKKRWKKLKFELEKLDFFQKLLKVKRTVANFNVRSLIIDQNRAEGLCLGGEESSLAGGCGSSSKKPATATTIEGSQLNWDDPESTSPCPQPFHQRATAGTPEAKK